MAKSSLLVFPVLLVLISIIEIRAASFPKSIPEDGQSTADFRLESRGGHRGAIHGGKRVVKNEDKICMADDDGKTVKCQKTFKYNGVVYHQCTHAGSSGYNHHSKSWCYYTKNGSKGADWGYCKGSEQCSTCSWKCYECKMITQYPVTYEPLCKKWCSNSNECEDNPGGEDTFGTDCTGC